ncbi:MAG: mevalonate kinase family protein [Candidatus Micrarchaeia archaeon]
MITASAPTKVIICGEHAVVYGGNAIAAPISFRNVVVLGKRAGKPKFVFCQSSTPDWHAELDAQGNVSGTPLYQGFMRMVQHIFHECGTSVSEQGQLHAELKFSGAPKGTGNSASIAAALAVALYAFLGAKPSRDQLFNTVQIAEKVAHGNPSGVDARTVISDCAQRFHKEWDSQGNVKFFFEDVDLKLPRGSELLIIDSKRGDEKPQTTAELVAAVAKYYFNKGAAELTAEERAKICAVFNPVIARIESQLHENGNAKLLGEYFNENHELLRQAGVSSKGIEEARKIALENSAYGAKLTGAGGVGGAVIALVAKEKIPVVKAALEKSGFKSFQSEFSDRGASVDRIEE